MHTFYMRPKDIEEALGVKHAMALKMMKQANAEMVKQGYSVPNSDNVHIAFFCEFHKLYYDKVIENILAVRKVRPKYSRSSPR